MNIVKKAASFLLISAFGGGICSCSGEIPVSGNSEKITLTFSFWEPGVYNELENGLRTIVDGYEKINPDVHIELLSQPVDGYQDWIKSQLISDSLPDIQSNHCNNLVNQYKAGLLVDITDFMNEESAYAPGEPWKNTFIPERLEQANLDYHNSILCNVPFFGTELGIFYNKTIYEELGLSVPKTWREFMDNCQAIESSGKIPIALMAQKNDAVGWLGWQIGGGLNDNKYLADKEFNVNGDNRISGYEIARAIISGKLDMSRDEDFKQCYGNYIDHLSEYLNFCPESLELEESIAKAMFLRGEAAHIHTGSWDVRSLMKNSGIDFQVGVFKFPEFTSEDTPYTGKGISSSSVQSIAVTKSVYGTEGKLEAAIDFLQYFTQRKIYQQFIDLTTQLPVIKDVDIDEDLECFINDGHPPSELFMMGQNKPVYDILSGNPPVLDDKFFEAMQEAAENKARSILKDLNLNEENVYQYEEKQYGGEYIAKTG